MDSEQRRERVRRGEIYHSGVVDEVVQPRRAEDGLELRRERADVVEVGNIELRDVQRALCAALQRRERGGFIGVAARRDDEVRRGLEELSDEFEAYATRSSKEVRIMLISVYG